MNDFNSDFKASFAWLMCRVWSTGAISRWDSEIAQLNLSFIVKKKPGCYKHYHLLIMNKRSMIKHFSVNLNTNIVKHEWNDKSGIKLFLNVCCNTFFGGVGVGGASWASISIWLNGIYWLKWEPCVGLPPAFRHSPLNQEHFSKTPQLGTREKQKYT